MEKKSDANQKGFAKDLVEIRKVVADLLARLDRILAEQDDKPVEGAPPAVKQQELPPPKKEHSSTDSRPSPGDGQKVLGLGLLSLEMAIAVVLRETGKPMTFEAIFKRLEEGKAKIPSGKPKLAVRRALFNRNLFVVDRGAYVLKE